MNTHHLWIFISYLSATECSPVLVPVKFLPNRGVKLFLLAWLYSSSSEVWREISNLQQMVVQALQIRVNTYGGLRISVWTFLPYGSAVRKQCFLCKSVPKFNGSFPMFSSFCNFGSTVLKAPQGNSRNAFHLHPGTIFPWIHDNLVTIEGDNISQLDIP